MKSIRVDYDPNHEVPTEVIGNHFPPSTFISRSDDGTEMYLWPTMKDFDRWLPLAYSGVSGNNHFSPEVVFKIVERIGEEGFTQGSITATPFLTQYSLTHGRDYSLYNLLVIFDYDEKQLLGMRRRNRTFEKEIFDSNSIPPEQLAFFYCKIPYEESGFEELYEFAPVHRMPKESELATPYKRLKFLLQGDEFFRKVFDIDFSNGRAAQRKINSVLKSLDKQFYSFELKMELKPLESVNDGSVKPMLTQDYEDLRAKVYGRFGHANNLIVEQISNEYQECYS